MKTSRNPVAAAIRVAGNLAYDRIARTRPTALTEIPGSARQITPEWMTAVLCGGRPGVRVIGLDIVHRTLGTHERCRIAITYDKPDEAAGLPTHVFTKTLPSLTTRMLVGFMGHARYEMLFYKQIRPDLAIETPLCYHSASDKRTFAAIHVIEDLVASKSASFADETTLLTKEQAFDMIELLARLHGTFTEDPRLTTELKWLVNYHDWFTIGVERVRTDRYHAKALTAAADVIPADVMARRSEMWPATMKALEIHRSGLRTVIHSDVHIGNWYVTGEGRMGLFDWQCVNTGHWSRDVSYALSSCLPIENRRAWERELLQRYLERIEEYTGRKLDRDESWRQYSVQMLHALTMWTQTLCHPPFQPNSQRDELTYELIRRITTAISDLKSLDNVRD